LKSNVARTGEGSAKTVKNKSANEKERLRCGKKRWEEYLNDLRKVKRSLTRGKTGFSKGTGNRFFQASWPRVSSTPDKGSIERRRTLPGKA